VKEKILKRVPGACTLPGSGSARGFDPLNLDLFIVSI
jgi:hypothetical protein